MVSYLSSSTCLGLFLCCYFYIYTCLQQCCVYWSPSASFHGDMYQDTMGKSVFLHVCQNKRNWHDHSRITKLLHMSMCMPAKGTIETWYPHLLARIITKPSLVLNQTLKNTKDAECKTEADISVFYCLSLRRVKCLHKLSHIQNENGRWNLKQAVRSSTDLHLNTEESFTYQFVMHLLKEQKACQQKHWQYGDLAVAQHCKLHNLKNYARYTCIIYSTCKVESDEQGCSGWNREKREENGHV